MRVTGHFGEALQGRLGPAGPVVLVTLPCPALGVRATWTPGPAEVVGHAGVLRAARARAFSAALGHRLTGRTVLAPEMPPGGGAGASTAALLALARILGATRAPETLARACLAAEGAVDPLMYPRPGALLWAPRAARMVAWLPAPPPLALVGGFFGPSVATDPHDLRFPDIADLTAAWRRAAARRDYAALGRIASMSAERTTALRGPADDPTAALAARFGALGWVRAHTGSARGLLFAPDQVPAGVERALRDAGFTTIIRTLIRC